MAVQELTAAPTCLQERGHEFCVNVSLAGMVDVWGLLHP